MSRAPLVGREVASCAVCFNLTSLAFLLIATISPTWSWGNVFVSPNVLASGNTGPWVAGQIWSNNILVPCACDADGICFASCAQPVVNAVLWREVPVELVCEPLSQVFVEWSGPLGYCHFPPDFTVPEFPPLPPNAAGYATLSGNVPAGTTFTVPSDVIAVEALIITGTCTVFFAVLLGLADISNESAAQRSPIVSALAAIFSFLTWTCVISAYAVWTSILFVQDLQSDPAETRLPVWVGGGTLFAARAETFRYGAAWGLGLAASILSFFAFVIHLLSIFADEQASEFDTAGGVPATAPPKSITSSPPQQQQQQSPEIIATTVPVAVGQIPVPVAQQQTTAPPAIT